MADAYTVALTLLSARELSEPNSARAYRSESSIEKTSRRRFHASGRPPPSTTPRRPCDRADGKRDQASRAIARHPEDRQAGINRDTAEDAVREVYAEVDEEALLDQAIERKLRGKTQRISMRKARRGIVRALAGQGFAARRDLQRLKLQ